MTAIDGSVDDAAENTLGYTRKLCEYRMGMCREYNNSFYADAECAEEQLGLPGRVFLHQFPESIPFVMHYSLKEYPQRNLALRCCNIKGSCAVPVFDHSSHTCVGVLEIVSLHFPDAVSYDKSFLGQMYDIFQEFGLLCFDGYKHYEMQIRDENKARTTAFQELKTVLERVCKIHELPLAMTWVPCSACNDLLRGQLLSEGVDCGHTNFWNNMFVLVSKSCHLRKGGVAGMSSYTANDIYVLEFFLPTSERFRDNSWTSLSLILGTMEENFRTFKLASGQELGDLLSVEVLDFQNGLKLHSVEKIQAKGRGMMLQPGHLDQPPMDAISNEMNVVSEAQKYNLPSLEPLQSGKVTMQLDSLAALQQEVAKRLDLEAGTYYVKYKDEENDLILIACDEDLQGCIHTFKSLRNTSDANHAEEF
ncbi:hypothetical protein RHGRI_006080 [Rhododendron griersonianum]|uniref:PB1 domain-containing protein n=1 Tax=Rhododendron griersonianum TaxID=479676 RepID=A0AAV6LFF6_9ERIC|nr:hypothetical protein RHGRI_006080 [Rhododendron griersonianum]